MNNAKYLRAALSTFSNDPAKHGLRWASRNMGRTHMFHAGVGIHSEMTEVVVLLSEWLQGRAQKDPELTAKLADELGDVAYFLRILAHYSKSSLPASGKRPFLKGTPSDAVFTLLRLSERMASLQKKNFYGPIMSVDNPKKIDVAATVKQDLERLYKLRALVEEFASIYWPLCVQMTGYSVAELYQKNIAKLATRYPAGFFDAFAEKNKDEAAELAAQA